MDLRWLILVIVIVVALVIGIIAFIIYRKKKQYDIIFKMMQQQKKQEQEIEKERAFAEKRTAMSADEASQIVAALGGKNNIIALEQHAIRIRVHVKDKKLIDQKQLKVAGVSGIIKTTQGLQLIVGDRAEQIASSMHQILESA